MDVEVGTRLRSRHTEDAATVVDTRSRPGQERPVAVYLTVDGRENEEPLPLMATSLERDWEPEA